MRRSAVRRVLPPVLLVAGVAVALCAFLPRDPCAPTSRVEDMNAMRQIVSIMVARYADGRLPVKDGALDVYRLVRCLEISGMILQSARSGNGPTAEEILRNDYTNFPWERYRGDGKLEGPPVPLLWEKMPDDHGGRLVALSDGSARYFDAEEFEALRKER